jgi:phosphotransferase system enzyme I (PtsI)
VGAHGASTRLHSGEQVIVDALNGTVLADCSIDSIHFFERRLHQEHERRNALQTLRDTPAVTRDHQRIELQANIELPDDVQAVLDEGGDGIGLYRTEFLYMNRDQLPTEEEHFQAYLRVIEGMKGHPVTIRTLDLGADKQCAHQPEPSACINPALGLRAIRLCLKETSIFRVQIRAILRASAHGPVRLMIPMLTNLWEGRQAREIIREEMRSLAEQSVAMDRAVPVGAMIETPAAALTAESFAQMFDFLSIGTNDLIQYTLAVDRADDSVNHLYDPLHPAVLILIHKVLEAGRHSGKPVAMCGEMAGNPRYIPLLLGMGLKTLSMHPASLPEVKQLIRKLDLRSIKPRLEHLLRNPDAEDFAQAITDLAHC